VVGKRKETYKIVRNKKKTYIKNVIESIEEDRKHKAQEKCIKQ
jgi:ribosomal protein S20